jgi:hypothetical protein
MVIEVIAEWTVGGVYGVAHSLSFEPIVFFSIFEFVTNALAYDDSPVRWINRDVSLIEEAMQIASHQQTVRDFVSLKQRIWLDVSCIQYGQCPLAREGAATLIGLRNNDTEGALAKPRRLVT